MYQIDFLLTEPIKAKVVLTNTGDQSLNVSKLDLAYTVSFEVKLPKGDVLFAPFVTTAPLASFPDIITIGPGERVEMECDIKSLTMSLDARKVEEDFTIFGVYYITSTYNNSWPGTEGPSSLVSNTLDFVIRERLEIEPSRWFDPEGRRPTPFKKTRDYQVYISSLNKTEPIETRIYPAPLSGSSNTDIYIIVNESIYSSITGSLNQYKTNLENSGYSVAIYLCDDCSPVGVRTTLQEVEGLKGAVLVGYIPSAWYEMDCQLEDPPAPAEHEEFPIDLYYMDLDGSWGDSDSDNIQGIEYAVEMGAKVINASWGYYPENPSQPLKDVIDEAGESGILFVAAAGNSGFNIDGGQWNPFYPAAYDSDNIIAVMSTDQDDERSVFSNWGPISVDLGAPGGQGEPYNDNDIYSTMPTSMTDAMEDNDFTTYYDHLAGTSTATPDRPKQNP